MDHFEITRLRQLPIEGVAQRIGLHVSRHKSLCPFHDDHHASLSFNTRSNTYRCFACDAHGGTIDLVMRHLGKSFPDACRWLADSHNVILTEWKPATQAAQSQPPTFDATRYEPFFERPGYPTRHAASSSKSEGSAPPSCDGADSPHGPTGCKPIGCKFPITTPTES